MTEVKEAPEPTTAKGPGQTKEVAPRTTSMMPHQAHAGPFGFMRRFAGEMDRLFEDFGLEAGWLMPRLVTRAGELAGRKPQLAAAEWTPRIDVLERGGQLVIRADLPGMTSEDVKVEVASDHVMLEGERKEETREEREGYYHGECRYGSFYRVVPLPEGVDTARATAAFRNGVLEVVMPMAAPPQTRARRVEVRDAS